MKLRRTHLLAVAATTAAAAAIFAAPLLGGSSGSQRALEETFDGDPGAPSTALLPRSWEYVATHRTHPRSPDGVNPDGSFGSYPADHGTNCAGPPNQHTVSTGHRSNSENPDGSFFICKNHMMSSMGDVEGYSVSAFYPRQEFDFSSGGTLEWDMNINDGHPRSWTEVMIVPRHELQLAPAQEFLPIDESYSARRIIFRQTHATARQLEIARTAPPADPEGTAEHGPWVNIAPNDPGLSDRRIRRKNRVTISGNTVSWGLQKADGTFNTITATMPGGLPFTRGLVVFKTHAYTPEKDGNTNLYTYHWDNVRFSGPKLAPFQSAMSTQVVNLEANGNIAVGSSADQTIVLPNGARTNPWFQAQVHYPEKGQVELNLNGRTTLSLDPAAGHGDGCHSQGWRTVRAKLDPAWLRAGANTLRWTVKPSQCAQGVWDGFAVKAAGIQFNGTPSPTQPAPTAPPAVMPPGTAPPIGTPAPTPGRPGRGQKIAGLNIRAIGPKTIKRRKRTLYRLVIKNTSNRAIRVQVISKAQRRISKRKITVRAKKQVILKRNLRVTGRRTRAVGIRWTVKGKGKRWSKATRSKVRRR